MVSTDIIRKVAKLARLNLTEDELQEFTKDANEVLTAFAVLEKAPVSDDAIVPLLPTKPSHELREDKAVDLFCTPQAIKLSSHKQEKYFRGPKSL